MEKVKNRTEYMEKIHYIMWLKDLDPTTGVITNYVKNLCNYIKERVPPGEKVLDVAICKGYPFASFFDEAGYSVYGVDISKELIEECRKRYKNIQCKVGDASNLDFPDNFFYAVYCFNSTWYFSDLLKSIDEMIRVTKPGGFVIFDIQNRNNHQINREYQKALFETKPIGKAIRIIKNIIKVILCRKFIDWNFIVYVTPIYPEVIYEHIKTKYGYDFNVMIRKKDDSLERVASPGSFEEFGRLIFVVEKR